MNSSNLPERKTLGFLGCGNMGSCILGGLIDSKKYSPDSIYVCNRTPAKVQSLKEKYNVLGVSSFELAEKCDYIIIGVKPYDVVDLLTTIRNSLKSSTVIVSIATGITINCIESVLGSGAKVIRAMPNVSCFVGAGATSLSVNSAIEPAEKQYVLDIFSTLGKVYFIPESSIHSFIGTCGSSPAYIFMFMEALSDAAVHGGISRKDSYDMISQVFIGAGKMLQTGDSTPSQLKDMVCSPGGTTIEAVRQLEKGGMRSSVIEAVISCIEKSRIMEKKYS